MNIPDGAGILRLMAEANHSTWAGVPRRDVPKHLHGRYWIDKWSDKRWPEDRFFHAGGKFRFECGW